ncbi:MAG TPA: hypothetical protein VGQ69_09800 [Gemmatimonadales bacterium]|nr:hypothetical protein [Gemmatimonadales bacterium]
MTLPVWVKGTLLLAVALAAGVALGATYERRRLLAHETARIESHHVMHRFQQELGLDSAQQQAIAKILARHQGAVDSTWHALRPHVRATLDSALREVLAVLRPDQVAKYRKMVEEMHPGTHP